MNQLYPIAYLDPPELFNASVTNIPGSGSLPLQVVSNIGLKAPFGLQYTDTTGDWIGVYIGVSGSEVLRTIIGGGVTDVVSVVIPANSRVSLRSMSTSSITNGMISIIFLGFGGVNAY
jgi:hypothetical protein